VRRREFLPVLAAPLLAAPALAQQPERVWRLGALAAARYPVEAIQQFTLPELAKLGFVEGRNLTFHGISADGAYERLPALARELVEAKPDVILAVAPSAIRAARAATRTIPIVMAYAGEDPVAAGWAESYARPGGNVTGVVMLSPELDGKRLQVLHDAFPARRRIGVLHHPTGMSTPNVSAIQAAAGKVGLEILSFQAAGRENYEAAFDAIRMAGVDTLAVASAPVFVGDAGLIAEAALKAGLPTICEHPEMARKGCLISYSANIQALRQRTAVFVARILTGTPPGNLPIEEPTSFELWVNMRTAKALGIELPPTLLARADEVIE